MCTFSMLHLQISSPAPHHFQLHIIKLLHDAPFFLPLSISGLPTPHTHTQRRRHFAFVFPRAMLLRIRVVYNASNSSIRCFVFPLRICRSVLYLSLPSFKLPSCKMSSSVSLVSSRTWFSSLLNSYNI